MRKNKKGPKPYASRLYDSHLMSLDAISFPGPSLRLYLIVLTHLSAMRLLITDYIFHGANNIQYTSNVP